jgi:hypothetical protein
LAHLGLDQTSVRYFAPLFQQPFRSLVSWFPPVKAVKQPS